MDREMLQVTATELRRHLFEYLQRVEHGESIQIKLNGRVVGCLGPRQDDSDRALQRLRELGATARVGDIVSPADDSPWNADENNL
jgi:prevent-host-death family protein